MKFKILRTRRDYRDALARVHALTSGPLRDGSSAALTLDLLTLLVRDYEDRHITIDPPDPIEAIQYRLEHGLTKKQLETAVGGAPRVSEILKGKRGLSLAMIRSLVKLGIPAASLIGEIHRTREYRSREADAGLLARERAARYRKSRARRKRRRS